MKTVEIESGGWKVVVNLDLVTHIQETQSGGTVFFSSGTHIPVNKASFDAVLLALNEHRVESRSAQE